MKDDDEAKLSADQKEELANLEDFIKKKEIQNDALKVLIDKVNSTDEEKDKK